MHKNRIFTDREKKIKAQVRASKYYYKFHDQIKKQRRTTNRLSPIKPHLSDDEYILYSKIRSRKTQKKSYRKNFLKNREKNNQQRKLYRIKHLEKEKERGRKYRLRNLEKCKEICRKTAKNFYYSHLGYCRKQRKEYAAKNKDKRNKYLNNFLRTNINYRLSNNLRSRIRIALKSTRKSESLFSLLGCSILVLKQHIEKQFLPNMTWQNHGRSGWHIDHIVPCSRFNLSDLEQQKKCFHYTNLQPLWAKDNLSKGKRILQGVV